MGTYDHLGSYKKTQTVGYERHSFAMRKPSDKHVGFTGMQAKAKKDVPPVGKYNPEKAYARLSSTPASLRVKRH